jgi:hypothetical protein
VRAISARRLAVSFFAQAAAYWAVCHGDDLVLLFELRFYNSFYHF